MEFDDDHDDDEQEEEDEDEEINLAAPQSYDSVAHPSVRPRIGQLGGGGGGGGNGGSVAVGGPQSAGRKIGVVGTKYRECLKNHAVNIGGYATDGCGEFMPAGEEGTLDALKCAACNCHRNFHRKETDGGGGDHAVSPAAAAAAVGGGVAGVGALYHALPPYYRTPTPTGYLHVATAGGGGMAVHSPSPAGAHLHRPLALPSPSGGTHSRDEMDDMSHPSSSGGGGGGGGGGSGLNYSGGGSMGKKRFRTKFSQEQKDKMLAFAEKLGWRMQKHDEAAVQQFCQEVQVKRQVLKVWMHNNKHTLGKKA